MVPLREYRPLKETTTKRVVFKKYFFLCEGKNTEYKYLNQITDKRKEIGIKDDIQLIHLKKTDEDKDSSQPKKLIELADNWKKKKTKNSVKEEFDKNIDTIVLVFDLDVIKNISDHHSLIDNITKKGYFPAVTNPCFELWLMLHKKNSYNEIIKPNEEEFLINKRISTNHTYASKCCSCNLGFNPKNKIYFQDFSKKIQCAIEQEKLLERKPKEMFGKIGSNIGTLLAEIIEEK